MLLSSQELLPIAGFFSTLLKKLKDEKTQNSSTKLKVSANLIKINAENKANKSKNEGNFDWNVKYMVIDIWIVGDKVKFGREIP